MAVTNNIREQRGIYQDDLAAAIGYSTKTVGRIERGDSPPPPSLCLGFQNTLICWWKMSSMWKIELGIMSNSSSQLCKFKISQSSWAICFLQPVLLRGQLSSNMNQYHKKRQHQSMALPLFLLLNYFILISDIYSSSEPLFFLTQNAAPKTISIIQISIIMIIVLFHAYFEMLSPVLGAGMFSSALLSA